MKILRSATYLPVHDVAASVREWESVLGFTAVYSAGSPPEFAILARDAVQVMLRRVDASHLIVPNEAQGGTWDLFCWVDDADAGCAEIRARGGSIVYGPVDQASYRMREFAVRESNGYVIGFGHSIAAASSP